MLYSFFALYISSCRDSINRHAHATRGGTLTIQYAIMCFFGPIHPVISGFSKSSLSSGSCIIFSAGMTARYAASPVATAFTGSPRTTSRKKDLTPSAPTMRSAWITSPDVSLTETVEGDAVEIVLPKLEWVASGVGWTLSTVLLSRSVM